MRILALIFLGVVSISGCATLFSPGFDELTITSEPAGATVWIDGRQVGKTPLTFVLDRDTFNQPMAAVRKNGYKSREFRIGKTLAVAAIFNLSGLSSWATDATTGNMIEYSPKTYYFELEAKDATTAIEPIKSSMRFALVNHAKLLTDISRGEGEHLKTYLGELGVSEIRQAGASSLLKTSIEELASLRYAYQFHRRIEKLLSMNLLSSSIPH